MKGKTFECSVSFTYDAENPVEAAKQFINTIQSNPNWYVDVREVGLKGKTYTVDTKTDECEEK